MPPLIFSLQQRRKEAIHAMFLRRGPEIAWGRQKRRCRRRWLACRWDQDKPRLVRQKFLDHGLILLRRGRAGNIEHEAPRPHQPGGLVQQPALAGGKAGDVLGLAPPFQLRVAAQYPQPRAGRIDEDPIKEDLRPQR